MRVAGDGTDLLASLLVRQRRCTSSQDRTSTRRSGAARLGFRRGRRGPATRVQHAPDALTVTLSRGLTRLPAPPRFPGRARVFLSISTRAPAVAVPTGVCVAAARPVGGAGRGSRSRWRCRSERTAPSSRAASRTIGRSASTEVADHAAAGSATKQQVSDHAPDFGHPQP